MVLEYLSVPLTSLNTEPLYAKDVSTNNLYFVIPNKFRKIDTWNPEANLAKLDKPEQEGIKIEPVLVRNILIRGVVQTTFNSLWLNF